MEAQRPRCARLCGETPHLLLQTVLSYNKVMDNRAKFYCWLIGKLERRHMTIQEIYNDWVESSSNIDGKELSVRTFHRYRE